MVFSDFIKNTISGETGIAWNYYHENICTENIFNADTSHRFIFQYFENGEKEFSLLLNPEEILIFLKNHLAATHKGYINSFEFDRRYALPDDRAIHMVSGFFLGLLIANCLNGETPLSIVQPEYFPFSYLWFLTFLYHDYGYCVAEKENSPIKTPARAPVPNSSDSKICLKEYHTLYQVKTALGINFSPFSGYPCAYEPVKHINPNQENILEYAAFQKFARQLCIIARRPKLEFNMGAKIDGHWYTSAVVTRYFNYCINELTHIEHGIIGGYLFYDRIIKNYLYSYFRATHIAQHPIHFDDFYFHDRHFSEKHLPVFSYIADCILSHNIWKQSKSTSELYERYNLNTALGIGYKTITEMENPLLYILAITDTLEPTKAYATIDPEIVSASISLECLPGTHILTISGNNHAIDISILHRRAKGLEEWTAVRCSELKDGAFTLYL